MRFDGWPSPDVGEDFGQSTSIYDGEHQHRQPSIYENGYLFGSPGGVPIDQQAILDREIAAATGVIDAFGFISYLEADLLIGEDAEDTASHPNTTKLVRLNDGLHYFRSSALAQNLKYCITVIVSNTGRYGLNYTPDEPWKYLDAFAQRIDEYMQDSNYLKILGRPVLMLYEETAGLMDLAHWQQFLASCPPCFRVNALTNASTTTLGLNAQWKYGPNGKPAGAGRLAASEQMTADISTWTAASSRKLVTQLTPLDDARAQNPSVSSWVDQYTQPQWVWHVANAYARGSNHMIPIYAWNELAEGGPGMVPNAQEAGSPSLSGNRLLEGIRWVRTGVFPTSFIYEVSCALTAESLTAPYPGSGIERSGTWTTSQPAPNGVLGAHDSDEETSTTTGDYVGIAHPGVKVLGLYCVKGPDRGIVTITRDGGDPVDVDLYAAVQSVHQLVWSYDFGDSATHAIRATVKGDKNPSSSSVKVGCDSFYVDYNPNAVKP